MEYMEGESLRSLIRPDAVKVAKEFDCVQMKAEIQERLLSEIAEVGEEEAGKRRKERLLVDPILGRFLRAKMASQKEPAERAPAV